MEGVGRFYAHTLAMASTLTGTRPVVFSSGNHTCRLSVEIRTPTNPCSSMRPSTAHHGLAASISSTLRSSCSPPSFIASTNSSSRATTRHPIGCEAAGALHAQGFLLSHGQLEGIAQLAIRGSIVVERSLSSSFRAGHWLDKMVTASGKRRRVGRRSGKRAAGDERRHRSDYSVHTHVVYHASYMLRAEFGCNGKIFAGDFCTLPTYF